MNNKKTIKLRSSRWFKPNDLRSFGHRSRAMQMGYDIKDWEDKTAHRRHNQYGTDK